MRPTPAPITVAYGTAPAHEMLRLEVARRCQVAADEIVLTHECRQCGRSDHGRPVLAPTRALRSPPYVSLARAGGLSVVAIADEGPVGIDVEAEGAAEFPGFADVALHPREHAPTPSARVRAWVHKEALLKATGWGLAVDPRDVLLDDGGLVAWDDPRPSPSGVRIHDVVIPLHVAAVALLGPAAGWDTGPPVEVRRSRP